MEKQLIAQALSSQIFWLRTWKTAQGAYNGYVVHRHDLKRMFNVHDTPWAQAPVAKGYLNLYLKTKDRKWLQEATQAVDLQVKRLCNSGKYIYAGFEDDRFSNFWHCSRFCNSTWYFKVGDNSICSTFTFLFN